jgi:hypothetical protein
MGPSYSRPVVLVVIGGLSAAFAVSRFFQPVRGLQVEDIYKDMAHIWVGGLLLAGLALFLQGRRLAKVTGFIREQQNGQGELSPEQTAEVVNRLGDWTFTGAWKWVAGAGVALTLVEIAAFLIGKL